MSTIRQRGDISVPVGEQQQDHQEGDQDPVEDEAVEPRDGSGNGSAPAWS